jgi:hypothetical protein
MFRRFAFVGIAIALIVLPCLQALAGSSVNFSFTMPAGLDPPVKHYLGSSSVDVSGSDLDPSTGVELHGRSLNAMHNESGNLLIYKDVTQIQVQFVFAGKITVKSSPAQGLKNYKPWTVQTFYDSATSTWTILFTAQPGSALLSDWDQTGGLQGFFGSMTASQGSNAAPLSHVTITPMGSAMNAYQRPASDVSDSTAPTINASVDSPTIWSPNKMPVNVTLTAALQDTPYQDINNFVSGLDPSSVSVTLTQLDGSVSTPLGAVPFQMIDNGDGTFGLTALLSLSVTRDGFNADGRIYSITISAQDSFGNLRETTVTVTVTHDQSP